MALIKRQKGTSVIIQLIIIIVGIVGGYFYYSQIIKPNEGRITVTNISTSDTLSRFKDVNTFDFATFADVGFRSLKIIGEAPVQPVTGGRTDIFAPF